MRTAQRDLVWPKVPTPVRSWRVATVVGLALVVAVVGLRLADQSGVPQVRNLLLVFGSLLVEAFPFILLGALVSAIIEVFVPARAFARLARLPGPLQMPVAGLGGFAFPVCECGSVPVARRLVSKGLGPGAAVTFMLAAPVLNPVVLVATAIAYRGRPVMWGMVGGRAVLALAAALAVGWVVGGRRAAALLPRAARRDADHEDPHSNRWRAFFGHLGGDFVMLGRYLVVGAALAGILQTFVPQTFIGTVAEAPVLSVLSMMALAAMLSLCSESDAFVAASFVQFGAASQLAFLVFGPMFDAKLAFLYAGTFGRRFTWIVAVVAGAVTLAGALWLEVVFG
jgi:uncharacterized membrane protein YraQ (UPF0718 family)